MSYLQVKKQTNTNTFTFFLNDFFHNYFFFISREKIKKKKGVKCSKCGVHVHEKKCRDTFIENENNEKEAEKKRLEEEEKKKKAAAAKANETPKKQPAKGGAAADFSNLTDAEIDSQFELIAVNNGYIPHKNNF